MTATRSDLPFIRRRLPARPDAAAAAVVPLVAAAPTGRPSAPRLLPPLLDGVALADARTAVRLEDTRPVVMLDRVHSAVGALTCALASGADIVMSVAYQARGVQGVLSRGADGNGPDATHPRLSLTPAGASVDLGHVDEIDRFVVLLGPSREDQTLLVRTPLGVHVDLDVPAHPGTGHRAVLTGHVARRALVLRRPRPRTGSHLRDAVTAYGFDSITWATPDRALPPHTSA